MRGKAKRKLPKIRIQRDSEKRKENRGRVRNQGMVKKLEARTIDELTSSLLQGAKDTQISFHWRVMQRRKTIPNSEKSERGNAKAKACPLAFRSQNWSGSVEKHKASRPRQRIPLLLPGNPGRTQIIGKAPSDFNKR